MGLLGYFRLGIFAICILLTVPVLGLAADWTRLKFVVNTQGFEAIGLLAASVSLLLLPLLVVVSLTRKNAFILYVVSELSIIGVLWVLWVAAAGVTIQKKTDLIGDLSCSDFIDSEVVQKCNELLAIEGLEVVIFVLLLIYLLILGIHAIVIHARDKNGQVWFQPVGDMQSPELPALTHTSNMGGSQSGNNVTHDTVPMNTYPNTGPTTYTA